MYIYIIYIYIYYIYIYYIYIYICNGKKLKEEKTLIIISPDHPKL